MLRLFWVKRKPETKGEKMERFPVKPLSRKKLRQLMPRNYQDLTSLALSGHGHGGRKRHFSRREMKLIQAMQAGK